MKLSRKALISREIKGTNTTGDVKDQDSSTCTYRALFEPIWTNTATTVTHVQHYANKIKAKITYNYSIEIVHE